MPKNIAVPTAGRGCAAFILGTGNMETAFPRKYFLRRIFYEEISFICINCRKCLCTTHCTVRGGGGKKPGLFSAGVGVFLPVGLGGGYSAEGSDGQDGTYKQELTFTNVGFGGFAFLDAKYVEAALSFSGGSSTYKSKVSYGGESDSDEEKGSYTAFDISALGKYPVAFGKFTAFPLLGIDYQIVLSQKDEDGNDIGGENSDIEASDFSALWFRAGAGGDFSINEKLYLRGEILYGIRLHNKFENEAEDDYDADVNLGHGPVFKLGIGYRF
jgi:hypothetical protein